MSSTGIPSLSASYHNTTHSYQRNKHDYSPKHWLGNITRINNLLESYPEKLAEAEQRLKTVQEQLANAKEEDGKPFPKEEELNQKLERLSELNALLNMDEREDTETEQSESKEKEERPARGSIHEKLQIYKEKSQRESETGKENRKRDFGLE